MNRNTTSKNLPQIFITDLHALYSKDFHEINKIILKHLVEVKKSVKNRFDKVINRENKIIPKAFYLFHFYQHTMLCEGFACAG